MPVGPGQDTLDGEPYQRIIQAANSGTCPGASALIDFYFEWSKQARANESLLTHAEAIAFDPQESSALRYDPTCVLYAAQILTKADKSDDYMAHIEIPGLWFDDEAWTYVSDSFQIEEPISDVCPSLSDKLFDDDDITDRRPLTAAIGYRSDDHSDQFIETMADALSCARDV